MSPRLNPERMKRNITETDRYDYIIHNPEEYKIQMAQNEGLYRYTNLDNEEIYFNSNIQRLIQNYRSSFLQLGLHKLYSGESDGKLNTRSLLGQMDTYFPPEVIPVSEPDLDIQIGRIYSQAGDSAALKKRLKNLQTRPSLDMETHFYIGQVYINELNDYESAIALYNNLKETYPLVGDIRYALIQAYSQIGRAEEAIKELEDWLIVNPTDDRAKEMLKFLRSQA